MKQRMTGAASLLEWKNPGRAGTGTPLLSLPGLFERAETPELSLYGCNQILDRNWLGEVVVNSHLLGVAHEDFVVQAGEKHKGNILQTVDGLNLFVEREPSHGGGFKIHIAQNEIRRPFPEEGKRVIGSRERLGLVSRQSQGLRQHLQQRRIVVNHQNGPRTIDSR